KVVKYTKNLASIPLSYKERGFETPIPYLSLALSYKEREKEKLLLLEGGRGVRFLKFLNNKQYF
ncbi:hypothetical protein, partial [Nodularia sphaerocarpa]|uniref:hypothetical protein n=1 Tax=Nodularia sphaerocarpa TaxID=137816 RepID=UPI0023309DCD